MSIQAVDAAPMSVSRSRDSRGRFVPLEKPPTIKQLWKYSSTFMELGRRVYQHTNRARIARAIDRNSLPGSNSLPTIEEYARLISRIQTYNRAIDASMSSIVQQLGRELRPRIINLRDIFNFAGQISAEYQYGVSPRRSEWPVKQSDVMNDLLAICKTWPTVWDREKKTLKISTNEIVIPHLTNKTIRYRFGRFYIFLATTESTSYGGLSFKGIKPEVKAQTPRLARGHSDREQIAHPHVIHSASYICLGNGESAAINAMKSGRLFDAVEITYQVLQTFGMNPFSDLTSWDGICDERFNPATGEIVAMDAVLPETRVFTCSNCKGEVSEVFDCSHPGCRNRSLCLGCLDLCAQPGCNRRTCPIHTWYCEGCDRNFCGDTHFSYSSEECNMCWAQRAQESEEGYDEDEEEIQDEDSDEEDP